MTQSSSEQSVFRQLLQRAGAGENTAFDALVGHACERLTTLARHMLNDYPRVRRWVETDDVLQNALVRLHSALKDVRPNDVRDFFALAALQLRRELIDLVRRYFGPQGLGANHDTRADEASSPDNDPPDLTHEPSELSQWTELHEQIDQLPDEEREVVDLLFYQGLPQAEAADLLSISVRTLQRRWHTVLYKLYRIWHDERQV